MTQLLLLSVLLNAGDMPIAGWLETAKVFPGDLTIKAKLDTGAKTSSLDARHMERFERKGDDWVRFDVTDSNGKKVTLEAPITRVVKIKRHKSPSQERPVVSMSICLGNVSKKAEVNLVDRRVFNNKLLIGRNFLAGSLIVDPSSKYITKPSCGERNVE